jgi:hypothetical protein
MAACAPPANEQAAPKSEQAKMRPLAREFCRIVFMTIGDGKVGEAELGHLLVSGKQGQLRLTPSAAFSPRRVYAVNRV